MRAPVTRSEAVRESKRGKKKNVKQYGKTGELGKNNQTKQY